MFAKDLKDPDPVTIGGKVDLAGFVEPLPQGVPDRVLRSLGFDPQAGQLSRFLQVLVPAFQRLRLLYGKVADGPSLGFILVCHALASRNPDMVVTCGVVGTHGLQMVNGGSAAGTRRGSLAKELRSLATTHRS